MKMRVVLLSLIFVMSWWLSSPLWAEAEKSAGSRTVQQDQSTTEELMSMLKETMGILRNLDHAPSADEKRHLGEMMGRLDVMLKQQQQMMQDLRDQQESIRQQQDEFFRRQRILEQQQQDLK
jgi:hypothetical protein